MKILIVTGFLGSGKTTWIKDFLNRLENAADFIIVENDFGPINLDAKLLENKKMDIYSLDSGCICCSLKDFFEDSLRDIIQNYGYKNIIIEPSGLAFLSDLLKNISAFKAETRSICLLDGRSWEFLLENHGEYYEDQIILSDFLVVNRIEPTKENTKEEILSEFPKTTLIDYETSFDLANKFFFAPINKDISMDKKQDIRRLSQKDRSINEHIDVDNTKKAEDDFQSLAIKVRSKREGYWKCFFENNRDLLKNSECLRMKGIVIERGLKKIIQYSSGEYSFSGYPEEKTYQADKAMVKKISRPIYSNIKAIEHMRIEKSDYINRFIFIGKNLDKENILKVFKEEKSFEIGRIYAK